MEHFQGDQNHEALIYALREKWGKIPTIRRKPPKTDLHVVMSGADCSWQPLAAFTDTFYVYLYTLYTLYNIVYMLVSSFLNFHS